MTYSVEVYNNKGKVVKTIELDAELFGDHVVNKDAIHEYYLYQQANAHTNAADSKTRAEVQGSGKKLFKQKGTSNARPGDRRSPIRVHGWVAFGPKSERNFTKGMNKKVRNLALRGLLSMKAKENKILGLDEFETKEPKTKLAADVLKNIGLDNTKVLFVLGAKNDAVEKSFRNIKNVKYIHANYLNPADLMKYDTVLMLEDALTHINTK